MEDREAHLRRLNLAQGDALVAIRHALLCPTGEHDYHDLQLGREEAEGVVQLHARLTFFREMILGLADILDQAAGNAAGHDRGNPLDVISYEILCAARDSARNSVDAKVCRVCCKPQAETRTNATGYCYCPEHQATLTG